MCVLVAGIYRRQTLFGSNTVALDKSRISAMAERLLLVLAPVVVLEESVALRELGAFVGQVAAEEQEIARLYLQGESHEAQRVQAESCNAYTIVGFNPKDTGVCVYRLTECHFSTDELGISLDVGQSGDRDEPVGGWAPEVRAADFHIMRQRFGVEIKYALWHAKFDLRPRHDRHFIPGEIVASLLAGQHFSYSIHRCGSGGYVCRSDKQFNTCVVDEDERRGQREERIINQVCDARAEIKL